jgi:hypothetical protein
VTFPPSANRSHGAADPKAIAEEYQTRLPGLAESFERDGSGIGSGMHATASIDHALVLDGELWLELDDGETVHLHADDIVIQQKPCQDSVQSRHRRVAAGQELGGARHIFALRGLSEAHKMVGVANTRQATRAERAAAAEDLCRRRRVDRRAEDRHRRRRAAFLHRGPTLQSFSGHICDVYERFAEIATLKHANEGGGRLRKPVGDVLTIANATVSDARGDRRQEIRIMLCCKFVINITP